jgi:CrcB protein
MILMIVVGIGGSVGAVSRYLIDGAVQDRTAGRFPFGTMTVNVAGSLVLGCATALALRFSLARVPSTVIGAGFCGALTTWSTASWETVRLIGESSRWMAARYLTISLAASLAAAGLGFLVVRCV